MDPINDADVIDGEDNSVDSYGIETRLVHHYFRKFLEVNRGR